MNRVLRAAVAAFVVAVIVTPAVAQQQPDPDSPRYQGVVALDEFLGSEGDESIEEFIETRIAASLRDSAGDEALAQALTALRAQFAYADMRGARPVGSLSAELIFNLEDNSEASVEFELDPNHTDRFLLIRSGEHTIGG